MRARIGIGVGAVLIVAALGLSGCAPTPPVPVPSVLWTQIGQKSPLEGDPAVRAVRASQLQIAIAWNTANWDRKALLATTGEELIKNLVEFYPTVESDFRHDTDPMMYAGPPIWQPISVSVNANSTTVTGCDASGSWAIAPAHPAYYDLTHAFKDTYRVTGASGHLKVSEEETSNQPCVVTSAPVGRFTPLQLRPLPHQGDVKYPSFASPDH